MSLTENIKDKDIIEKLKANKLTGKYEDGYMQIVGKYKENKSRPMGERPADYFGQAWGKLLEETSKYEQDILGDIYQEYVSHGENGQFFTPEPVADIMAQLVGSPSSGRTVNDPACGSGRFFISLGKQNKSFFFEGTDISPICAKMTTLNMWLFDLNSDIYCGDTLTQRMNQVWRVRRGGYIFENIIENMPGIQPEPIKPAKQTLFDLSEFKKKAA